MSTLREIFFRPAKTPLSAIPFGVRSIGHYRLQEGNFEKPHTKHFLQLFWGIDGKGEFKHLHERHILSPNQIFIYFPGDTHTIRSLSNGWEYRWLTLDGSLNEALVRGFGLTRSVHFAGQCPHELFILLSKNILNITPSGEHASMSLAFQILSQAGGGMQGSSESKPVANCRRIFETEFANALLSIENTADRLNIHRSSLCRTFRKEVGVSPQEYLAAVRIRCAIQLLKDPATPISRIAEQSGFQDPNYFSRVIKRATGINPLKLRLELTGPTR